MTPPNSPKPDDSQLFDWDAINAKLNEAHALVKKIHKSKAEADELRAKLRARGVKPCV